jgi:ComF family protein
MLIVIRPCASVQVVSQAELEPLINRILQSVIAFALPPRCPGCGIVVDGDGSFCVDCWLSLNFLPDAGCSRCNTPMEIAGITCARCLASPPAHDQVIAAVAYGDIAKSIALKFKYGRRIGLSRTIAGFLRTKASLFPDALLVPVPLHRRRLWSRGFNQSVLIANDVSRLNGNRVALDILMRTTATPKLGTLGARERAKAVRGAFSLSAKAKAVCAGKTILLVDDVYTSGATANACAKLLKKAGAANVHVICWARVLQSDDDTY